MGKIQVSQRKPPRLGNGIYEKEIPYKDERQFVLELTDWVKTFVTSKRAMHLVMQAPSLADILAHIQHAPATMAIPGPEGRLWRVYISFEWGQTSSKQWWVSGVDFAIRDSEASIAVAQHKIKVEKLKEKAEERAARRGPSTRVLYFEAEKHSKDFGRDVEYGRNRVNDMISEVYGIVKELAKMPTNPIGPDPDDGQAILVETLKGLGGAGTGGTVDALEMLGYEAGKVYQIAKKAAEAGDKVSGHVKTAARGEDFNKVGALVDLIDIGIMLKGGSPLTALGGVLLGSMLDIAIANQAGPISKVRCHMYACFVGGFMSEVVNSTSVKPERDGDNVFYDYGKRKGRNLTSDSRYYVQLALMHYGLTHPRPGWNLNAMFPDSEPVFPADYIRYWSESFVEDTFLMKFCKPDFLYR